MSEPSDNSIKIELPQFAREFVFETPQKLLEWQDELRSEWQWLTNTPAKNAWSQQESRLNAIRQASNDWMRNPGHQGTRDQARNIVHGVMQQMFSPDNSLFGNQAHIKFIKDVLQKHGHDAAAGVFAVLSRSDVQFERNVNEAFFGGLLRGFLFQNEIDWTASTHRKLLEELETQYKQRLEDQDARLQQMEVANQRLNEAYDSTLKAKSDSLEALTASKTALLDGLHQAKETLLNDLHAAKEKSFNDLGAEYEKKYQAIKKIYTDELALRAPVQYWKESHSSHVKLASYFAALSVSVLGATAWGLIQLIHWAFGSLGANENPKHWEVGVVVVSTFFAVWIVRIIIRLFLSHQHLATDAAQKVTMVQTYLALSQEEGGVAKEDRSIVLQQLFKSAADGIVKEDGTPPGLLEYLSRSK